jgi:hypothetical protein
MMRVHLAIDQFDTALGATSDEARERHFGGIGFATEHRFAKKNATDPDAIESTDQLSGESYLDAMGDAASV